jgi:uncharacterized membrane protein
MQQIKIQNIVLLNHIVYWIHQVMIFHQQQHHFRLIQRQENFKSHCSQLKAMEDILKKQFR